MITSCNYVFIHLHVFCSFTLNFAPMHKHHGHCSMILTTMSNLITAYAFKVFKKWLNNNNGNDLNFEKNIIWLLLKLPVINTKKKKKKNTPTVILYNNSTVMQDNKTYVVFKPQCLHLCWSFLIQISCTLILSRYFLQNCF